MAAAIVVGFDAEAQPRRVAIGDELELGRSVVVEIMTADWLADRLA